jgi:hypothetical protein
LFLFCCTGVTAFEDELNRDERKLLAEENEAQERPHQFEKKLRKMFKVFY